MASQTRSADAGGTNISNPSSPVYPVREIVHAHAGDFSGREPVVFDVARSTPVSVCRTSRATGPCSAMQRVSRARIHRHGIAVPRDVLDVIQLKSFMMFEALTTSMKCSSASRYVSTSSTNVPSGVVSAEY